MDPSNWTLGVPSPWGVAQINNAGTAQISSGTPPASDVYLGLNIGQGGLLLLSGGTLAITKAEYVGSRGLRHFQPDRWLATSAKAMSFIWDMNPCPTGVYNLSGHGNSFERQYSRRHAKPQRF